MAFCLPACGSIWLSDSPIIPSILGLDHFLIRNPWRDACRAGTWNERHSLTSSLVAKCRRLIESPQPMPAKKGVHGRTGYIRKVLPSHLVVLTLGTRNNHGKVGYSSQEQFTAFGIKIAVIVFYGLNRLCTTASFPILCFLGFLRIEFSQGYHA